MLPTVAFAVFAADASRGFAGSLRQLNITGLDLPVFAGVAANLIVHFENVRDGNLLRTMAHTIAAGGTGDGGLLFDQRPYFHQVSNFIFRQRFEGTQILFDLLQCSHAA